MKQNIGTWTWCQKNGHYPALEESSKLTFSLSIDKLCFEREKEKQEDLKKKKRKNLKNRRKRVKRNTKYKEKKKN